MTPPTTVTVAGIRCHLDEDAYGLDDTDFADDDITVRWTDTLTGQRLGAPSGLEVWIDDDTALLPVIEATSPMRGWQLRQVAPILAAWLGHLTLHASAVDLDGSVVAFVGASEVGKSTLAWELTKAGAAPVADDALPVRFTDDAAVTGADRTPIGAVLFPMRGAPDPELTPLAKQHALSLHLENGFGEHDVPAIWARQFDAYHRLVELADHHVLALPDDRARLTASIPWLVDRLTGAVTP